MQSSKSFAKKTSKKEGKLRAAIERLDLATKRLPKGTFARVGSAVGGSFGGPKGALLGALAGRGIAAITGRGDYEVQANSLSTIATSMDELPQFVKNKHSVRITHREYVGDILVPTTPTAFNNTEYVLNPGNGALFPWLALMAKQYQQYKVRGMVVEFKSNTSDYALSGPLGVVGIASNYNVGDVKYPNLVAFENSEYAVVSKPSRSMIHAIECAPRTGRDDFLFVRDPASIDPTFVSDDRFYDLASIQVMTSGLPGSTGSLLGQLFVSYDIEFCKPVISPQAVIPVLTAGQVFTSNPSGAVSITAGARKCMIVYTCPTLATISASTAYNYVDLTTVTTSGDNALDGSLITNRTATQFRLNRPGRYRFIYAIVADTAGTGYIFNAIGGTDTTGAVAYNGSATGTSVTWSNAPQMPHACVNVSRSYGYRGTVTGELDVYSADSTNNVTVTVPQLTSHSTLLVSNVIRILSVEWTSSVADQVVV